MKSIAFIDTEIEPKTGKVLDIGMIRGDDSSLHSASVSAFVAFIRESEFICGHNILHHDLKYLGRVLPEAALQHAHFIDTLYLSPLLFPTKPYHALVKDDKLQTEENNNPLNDAIKARDLFHDEVAAFAKLHEDLRQIYCTLLGPQKEFRAFFEYLSYTGYTPYLESLIRKTLYGEICEHADLRNIIIEQPIELAYCIALLHSMIEQKKISSITPPWVLKRYPRVESIMNQLRDRPCVQGCAYCNKALDSYRGLKRFFGYDSFRTYGGEPLQEKAVQAAIQGKSILAVFPTGGGKSITFQLPALMSGESLKGLTVVISPLQSLMKDQVDNLEKIGNTDAVTINGLLDPIERAKSIERVEDGSAKILYLSPESLRSKTIERMLLGRKIVRFVIDEAHCFSAWGQDFRVDYLYIGDFIRALRQKKGLEEDIPVSCFTATAKQKVIEDIREYFRQKLSLELELFTSKASRTNLHYKVFEKDDPQEKYQALRQLIEEKDCPTIIYVSRTRMAYKLSKRLSDDGFVARPYHGKMESREKTANQNAFISGEVPIMVATSAFGMGVDKKDVGMVIHYEISDSLENYIQEAGRAGRDEQIEADCYVLFNEEDLNKHFILLNQTKLSIKEIQQVWKAIRDITKFRKTVSNSALEIARMAGWDENVVEIETRVITAIAALEEAGYLKRGQNMPRVFANSILSRNAREAIDKIMASERFDEKQKQQAVRIMRKLFSSKSRKQSEEDDAESRVDYISDHLGIVKGEVIQIIQLLREEKILADAKDLTAYLRKGESTNRSQNILQAYARIERYLLSVLSEEGQTLFLKEVNEQAERQGCEGVTPNKIKTLLNFWAIKHWAKRQHAEHSQQYVTLQCLQPLAVLREKMEKRHALAGFVVRYLYERYHALDEGEASNGEEVLVEFSVQELREEFERQQGMFEVQVSTDDIEDALFYLSRIESIKIEGGFMVVYNGLTIERLEQDNRRRYNADDYQKLSQFYESKVQQIHIVGEYAKRMLSDYRDALQFVEDYFHLNYSSFLNKYFKGSRQNEIKRNLTPAKFRQLFGELSPSQLKIINDSTSKYIVVAAGPGSGKTRLLVHKLASLLLMEDVKHEQLLMLTFSRAAATEFKMRLMKLIGNAAHYIDIKTFHSYCFDLLGKVGSLEKSDEILKNTVAKIRDGDVERSKITKTVLVLDEAQDMNEDEFSLVNILIQQNQEMRVIAVGDDDQNIYEFRGSSAKYLQMFLTGLKATKYELIENYRSKSNLVDFANQFIARLPNRLKDAPIIAKDPGLGTIKLFRHPAGHLTEPVVNDILSTPLTGTSVVLTRTNDEAMQVWGLLLKHQIPARLIQTNEGFNLYHLVEVREMLEQLRSFEDVLVISDDDWEKARRELRKKFHRSRNLDLIMKLMNDFEACHTKIKYRSDLEVFIRESRLEDFVAGGGETVYVSTMHKVKGKEFDNVFLMLSEFNPDSDASKRQLYVAMTRARNNLSIHLSADFLDGLQVENLERFNGREVFLGPLNIALHLTYKDVWLDYFINRQFWISALVAGDELYLRDDECFDAQGHSVLKLSKQGLEKLNRMKERGYTVDHVKVNFIIYWKKEDSEVEVKIILPELFLSRKGYG